MREKDRKQRTRILLFLAAFFIFAGSLITAFFFIGLAYVLNKKEVDYWLQKRGIHIQSPITNIRKPQVEAEIFRSTKEKTSKSEPSISKSNLNKLKPTMPKINKKVVALILFIMLVVGIINAAYVVVQHGTVGVGTRFGKVTGTVYEPGLSFMVPFVDKVVVYNTKKIIYETSDNPLTSMADYTDYPVDTTTKDGQQITVRYSVRFSVDPEKVTWVANNLGDEIEIVEKVVKTDSRIHTRNIPRQYPASDLYTGNVEEVQQEIARKLTPIFEANGLILDEFGIRNISFTSEYVDAIESKQIEAEKVITEQNIAEQEKYKKEAAITKAEGEAAAQQLQQQTLSTELLQKMWIEKWDGKLPTYQGDATMMMQLPQ